MPPLEEGPRRETSKQLTGRIRLDYFKSPDRLTRVKTWLTAAAALAALAWVSGAGWDVRQWPGWAERTRALVSPGGVSWAHAPLGADCDACHAPFVPYDGASWGPRFAADGGAGHGKCKDCHAAPVHHANALGDASCASCHREHRGPEASLLAVGDENCTRCHSALDAHAGQTLRATSARSVTRFDGDRAHHPEFAAVRAGAPRDPGRIKFDHALHMSKGLTVVPGGRPLADGAGGGVQLRCDSCHRPDGGRDGGRLMTRVRYETDCRSCHPLDYDPDQPAARHGLHLSELAASVRQSYAAAYIKDHPEFEALRPAPRPVPGHEEAPELRSARDAIGKKVAAAERTLFGPKRCGECHVYEGPNEDVVPALDRWDAGRGVRVAAPGVKDVWLPHAAFDHSAHTAASGAGQAVGCDTCHARAYPGAANASRRSADVMLPSIAVCQTCHAPRSGNGASATGGARHDCVECHRYHGGDEPPALGSGPPSRGAEVVTGLKEFLRGTAREGAR